MTFDPPPADPAAFIAHLGNLGLVRHALAALRTLAARGVDLPALAIDELEEVELEILGRIPGGLAHLKLPTDIPSPANQNAIGGGGLA